MRGICLLTCFLLLFVAGAAAQDSAASSASPTAEVLTLEQAVSLSLTNNRTIKIAKLNAQIDEDAVAWSRPTVSRKSPFTPSPRNF
jgi:hypothetical protein